jgi:hypothetical protein
MPTSNKPGNLEFGGPAKYRIVVQGALSEASRRRFAGMTIEMIRDEGDTPRTILIGHVQDQAELRGLLDALYGLQLPVIAVEQCNGRGGSHE